MLIPYGHSAMQLNIDEKSVLKLESDIHGLVREASEDETVLAAMAKPFGGKKLSGCHF